MVRENDGLNRAAQCFGVPRLPLPRAHRVARRHKPQAPQPVNVFFPFRDEDAGSGLYRRPHFREVVQDAPNVLQAPNPSAAPVAPPLPEGFWILEPDALK